MKRVVCGLALLMISMAGFLFTGKETCYAKEKIVFDNVDDRKLNLFVKESYRVKIDKEELRQGSKITWSSSDDAVAAVNQKGKIKAKKTGKVRITAKSEKTGAKASFRLTVKKLIKAKKITIKTKGKYLFVDESKKFKAKVTPKKTGEELVWSSSNEDVATVDEDGEITGVAPGKATIVVQSDKTHKKAKKKIVVRKNEVSSFHFAESKAVVGIAQTKELAVKVTPAYVTDRKMLYTSSDPATAAVDANGKVTGKKEGTVTVRAVYEKNHALAAQCTVVVSQVKGMLTKEMLDKMNLQSVNNLMIVAHPDDETLFGGAHLISDRYLVVCLTNANSYRAADFNKAMDISEDERIMLSYPDTQELPSGLQYDPDYKWDYHQLAIQNDINLLLHYKKWDTVVTHNPQGEYGHYHHRKVNKYTTDLYKKSPDCAKRFMYFAKYYEKEQMTDAVKSTLPETNAELFEIKVKMLSAYESKHWTCFTWLWHIQPYEQWVYYDDWK